MEVHRYVVPNDAGRTANRAGKDRVASASQSKQKFGFSVDGSGSSWQVTCEIEEKQSQVAFAGGSDSTALRCSIGEWQLVLAGSTGKLSRDASELELSTYTASAISPRPDGYYVRSDGSDVAALSKSQLMVRKGMEGDTRAAVGAAAAALLIFSGIPS